jgi:hypothetical protein
LARMTSGASAVVVRKPKAPLSRSLETQSIDAPTRPNGRRERPISAAPAT